MNFYLISPSQNNINFNLKNFEKISSIINVKYLQLRPKFDEKKFEEQFLIEKYNEFNNFCKHKKIKLIINDNLKMAKKLNADGVHLGQNDCKCRDARKFLGQSFEIGISCNDSIFFAKEAQKNGADYIAFGPAFRSVSKVTPKKNIDLNDLKKKTKSLSTPYFIIGGVNHGNIKKLISLKIKNVALINSIWNFVEGPVKSAELYKKTLGL
ncbi:MAG: hypothetical protein CMP25_03225 [Rickettsiales bacterium]|nr:hypothetical protein [Rickettsiales bacterium]